MRLNGIILLLFVGVLGYAVLRNRAKIDAATAASNASFHPDFFLVDQRPTKNATVIIVANPGCSKPEAERARVLSAALSRSGIPNQVKPSFEYYLTQQAAIDLANREAQHAVNPMVIVRGWAKFNPTPQEVVRRYQSTGP